MAADTLDILERQRIVRLVIKEVLVGDDTIVIRHCIPVPRARRTEAARRRWATPMTPERPKLPFAFGE